MTVDPWVAPRVGDVFIRDTGHKVIVLQVRDEGHEKGLGKGYGPSMLAWPLKHLYVYEGAPHPFDSTILCAGQDRHGPMVWKHVGFEPEMAWAAIRANDERLSRVRGEDGG